jgi:ubiquinone biosynthesis protein COQ4
MQIRSLKYFSKLVSNSFTSRGFQRQPVSLITKYESVITVSNLSQQQKGKITDNCINLSSLQQNLIILFSGCGAIVHPKRADFVANINELIDGVNLDFLLFKMKAHPCGRELLCKRPRISQTVLDEAWLCEGHTFGGAYAQFMGTRAFSPAERPAVRFITRSDLRYVALRMRESHDFWHVIFGCSTSVISELQLKQIEFRYTNLPSAGLSYFLAPIRLDLRERRSLSSLFTSRTHVPVDKDKLIFSILEERLRIPLDSLRKELLSDI